MTTNLQEITLILLNDNKEDLTNYFKLNKNKKIKPTSTPINKARIISSPIKKIEHQLNRYKNKEEESLLCFERL